MPLPGAQDVVKRIAYLPLYLELEDDEHERIFAGSGKQTEAGTVA